MLERRHIPVWVMEPLRGGRLRLGGLSRSRLLFAAGGLCRCGSCGRLCGSLLLLRRRTAPIMAAASLGCCLLIILSTLLFGGLYRALLHFFCHSNSFLSPSSGQTAANHSGRF